MVSTPVVVMFSSLRFSEYYPLRSDTSYSFGRHQRYTPIQQAWVHFTSAFAIIFPIGLELFAMYSPPYCDNVLLQISNLLCFGISKKCGWSDGQKWNSAETSEFQLHQKKHQWDSQRHRISLITKCHTLLCLSLLYMTAILKMHKHEPKWQTLNYFDIL